MPVRKPSHRGGNMIGKFPSLKMGCMIAYESTIERDYLYLLDFERGVRYFEEQPLTLEYLHGGKTRHYTPDFLVFRADCAGLAECKPQDLIQTDENQRKFRAAGEWCAREGMKFWLITDRELRAGHYLNNVKLLTRYARHPVGPDLVSRVYACLSGTQNSMTLIELGRRLSLDNPSAVFPDLLHLAFHHHIEISLAEAPITPDSTLALPVPIVLGGIQ